MGIDLKKIEEKYSKNKPTISIQELIICTALIVIGCAIFSAMPDEMGIFGWGLFAVGTFLNVVGIFRLVAMIPEVKSDTGKKIAAFLSLIVAAFIQFAGMVYLYNRDGSGKAMAITTLSLCVSLGLIIYVVDFDDDKMKKKIVIACRIITVLLIAIAVFLNIRDGFSDASVCVGTILIIEALITGKSYFKRIKIF